VKHSLFIGKNFEKVKRNKKLAIIILIITFSGSSGCE
jgi:hypothetical protein